MTFTGSTPQVGGLRLPPPPHRAARLGPSPGRAVEDDARRAFGADIAVPHMAAAGAAIEHLARIALG